jgi:hypothetical protein
MKKHILLSLFTVLLLIPLSSFGNNKESGFKKNTVFIGGALSYSAWSSDTEETEGGNVTEKVETDVTILTISPILGFFIVPNFAIYFSLSKVEAEIEEKTTDSAGNVFNNDYDSDTNLMELGVRKYYPHGNINLYMGASLGIRERYNGFLDEKIISGHAGFLYMFSPMIGADLGIKIIWGTGDIASEDSNTISVEIGYFGITAFF